MGLRLQRVTGFGLNAVLLVEELLHFGQRLRGSIQHPCGGRATWTEGRSGKTHTRHPTHIHRLDFRNVRLTVIALERGEKTHEVRVFDRDYQVNQVLKLLGYDRRRGEFTGRGLFVRVTCITGPGTYGLPHNLGVMSIFLMGAVTPFHTLELSTSEKQSQH